MNCTLRGFPDIEEGHCQGGDLEDKEVHRSSSQVYPGSPSARAKLAGSGTARMSDGNSTNARIWKMSQETLIHAAFGSHWIWLVCTSSLEHQPKAREFSATWGQRIMMW
ncbi:hypothetical protein BDL97_06G006800 [Sphagnum fallax]|nr:hypothetical protein BDL97_06G006800 [Sphagnum fallax]